MRKKLLLASLALVTFIWLFTGGIGHDTLNKPIKQITETRALQLFGKRNIWVFDKSENIFNIKGQLIAKSYYNGNTCDSKYIYTYTKFDSLQKTIWLTGENLTGQRIDEQVYDSSRKLYLKLVYTINKAKSDTFLEEKSVNFYNHKNQLARTIDQTFSKEDTSIMTSIFNYKYNSKGLLVSKAHTFRAMYIPARTSNTYYTYDLGGRIKTKFEDNGDSTYYIINNKGQVTEEIKKAYPLTYIDKNWYDERGNNIKSSLDLDGGRVYEYIYDKNNRLLKEYHPGSFLFILKPCTTYEYEYY